MRLRSNSWVAAVLALGAFAIVGCGQGSPAGSAVSGTTAVGPPTTSCGISLCPSAPSTPPSATPATTGAPWVPATGNLAGLSSECETVSLVSARQDRDMVIVGIASQGLWAMNDGSATWAPLGHGIGSAVIKNRPQWITFDPADPNTFWENGIYEGGGAYKTVDNGVTFKQLGNLVHSDYVSVDLSDPARRTLLSGRHETSNLYRSADGGATWVDLSSTLPPGIGFTTSPLIINARVHLLGTAAGTASGVFRTVDGGATWSRVYTGAVSGRALVAHSDGAIYWLLANDAGIIKSTDQGTTWQMVVGPGQISTGSGSLIELPDGRLATVGRSVIVSANHGVTWQAIGPPFPYTPTGLTYSPFRKAFYIWQSDCNAGTDATVKPDAIERWDYDYTKP